MDGSQTYRYTSVGLDTKRRILAFDVCRNRLHLMDLLQGAMHLLQIQFKVHLHVQKLQVCVLFKLSACERVG